jgi:putative FmdB family regulatory protein
MPLYEYRCLSCGETFEKMQKFSDPPLEIHESCGGALEKLLSAPAIQFKGTGWYVTDYARGKSRSNPSNGKPAQADSKSEKTTDSKPESKPAEPSKGEKSKAQK